MSLDVYLTVAQSQAVEQKIYIRENGSTRGISRQEWDERYPNQEPYIAEAEAETNEVYSANITHNLNSMADEAGIYKALWRPDENGITKAAQLIEPLTAGLKLLQAEPERFKKFNPSNGWGTYDALVAFVSNYLAACEANPDADVSVSR